MTDKPRPIEYVFTENVPGFFEQHGISLLVSTYQAQFVMALSARPGGMTMTLRHFERPTGLAVRGGHMAMVTRRAVWVFRATGTLRDLEGKAQPYDLCYAPRQMHVTGDASGHEIAFVGNELQFVSTRFSCIATLHPDWSFVPRWMPPFVSACVPEDRCHLNGMAVDETGVRYATALGRTDTDQGWRENKASGGVIMEVPSGRIVSEGLAMPHSPRLYGGHLFVLDSGRGELQRVDPADGQRAAIARLPGYLRGLAFHDRYAFVGMCKMREKREFGGVPIEALKDQLKCGIQIIDLTRGESVGVVEFTRGVEELFDIHVVPVRTLHVVGMEDETIDGVFIVPPVQMAKG